MLLEEMDISFEVSVDSAELDCPIVGWISTM
jgi:hypothetical protein